MGRRRTSPDVGPGRESRDSVGRGGAKNTQNDVVAVRRHKGLVATSFSLGLSAQSFVPWRRFPYGRRPWAPVSIWLRVQFPLRPTSAVDRPRASSRCRSESIMKPRRHQILGRRSPSAAARSRPKQPSFLRPFLRACAGSPGLLAEAPRRGSEQSKEWATPMGSRLCRAKATPSR